MKAGIYKRRDNGKHIYVAKDRSIRAHQLTDCHPVEAGKQKVNCSEKEQIVSWDDEGFGLTFVYADRVADAPNGTTDHAAALTAYVERHGVLRDAKTGAVLGRLTAPVEMSVAKHTTVGKSERLVCMPPTLGMPYGTTSREEAARQSVHRLREADAGVPPHVAHKVVDAYREKYPHLSEFIANPAVVIAGATAAGARGAKSLADADLREAELRVAAAMPEGVNFIPTTGDLDALPHINGQRFFVVGGGAEKCPPMALSHTTLLTAEHDNDGKPFDTDSVKQTLSTIVEYEHAKKDLQVMLHLEQTGVVQWVGNDWEIFDLTAYNATLANPPKVLPVLPRGYMEERAAAYVRNRPFVSSAKHATVRPSQLPVFDGPCSSAYTKNYNATQRAAVSTEFEQLQRQLVASAKEAHELMAKAFFAEALGIVELVQDEVIVLDNERYESLESDLLAGRYKAEWSCGVMGIRDTSDGTVSLVAPYKAQFIAASNGVRVAGTMEEPVVLRTKSLTVTGRPMPAAAKRHGATGAVATSESEHEQLLRLANGEIRLIGKQSKRKHRRAGHRVFWCAPLNSWAWEVRS